MPGKRKASSKKRSSFLKRRKGVLLFFVCAVVALSFSFLLSNSSSSVCANSESCVTDLTGSFDPTASVGEFLGQTVTAPSNLASVPSEKPVLGITTSPNKRIEVDLTNQQLHAFEGDTEVMSFPISSGKWQKTPTGEFAVWIKLRYTRMKGGSKENGSYYDLPNVPYTMFFYNDQIPKWRGYGIHGAYWHNNFGHPMSHGCINVGLADIERLYNWASPEATGNSTLATAENPGTKIIIYGKAANY